MAIQRQPIVGVALGDPSGIGPEVALKAAIALQGHLATARLLLAGSRTIILDAIRRFRLNARFLWVDSPEEVLATEDAIPLLDIPCISSDEFAFGEANARCGRAATAFVSALVDLALAGRIAAVACAPISKRALLMAESGFIDHSQLAAHLCGSTSYGMVCLGDRIATMAVTGHVRLAEVAPKITVRAVLGKIELAARTFRELEGREPRIAVCSLDPHCGEGGLLGTIDEEVVRPSVCEAQRTGFTIDGPISADAVFRPYILPRFDLILGMYHDQVKVGIAALGCDHFVAYLAGVSIVRTTTTHGAAFDIAGRGIADPANMIRTIECAAKIARRRSVTSSSLPQIEALAGALG